MDGKQGTAAINGGEDPSRGSPSDIPDMLNQAVLHHQSGRLGEAERLYRKIMELDAGHADAMHLLGLIAHQMGRNEAAIELIGQAIRIRDDLAFYHNNLGSALLALGKIDEAAAAYERALALDPSYAEPHMNMGNILRNQGMLDQAAARYERALALKPDYALAHMNLGNALVDLGRIDEAIASHERAIALLPNYPKAHYNLGIALAAADYFNEAAISFERAISLKPDYVEAHMNIGDLLKSHGRLDEAAAAYERLLALRPDNASALNNLGNILFDNGDVEGAIERYQQALAARPDFAEVHMNLGNAFLNRKNFSEATAAYKRYIASNPDNAEAHNNLGNALHDQGEIEESIIHYEQALAFKPGLAEARWNLGNIFFDLGRIEDAIAQYEQGLDSSPDNTEARFYLSLGHFMKMPATEWEPLCRRFLEQAPLESKYEHDLYVRLAIHHWIMGDRAKMLDALKSCNAASNAIGPSTEKNVLSMRAYQKLLGTTHDYHAERNFSLIRPADKDAAVIGDSHCLSYAHTTLEIEGNAHKIVPHLIIGCKAWPLAKKGANQYKRAFHETVERLPPGTRCFMSMGEIDCRYNEGIIRHHKKTGIDLPAVVDAFVPDYARNVAEAMREHLLEVSFLGVPAPNVKQLYKNHADFAAEDEERITEVIRLFNDALKAEAAKSGCGYIDIYGLTAKENGKADGAHHIDGQHLYPDALALAFELSR